MVVIALVTVLNFVLAGVVGTRLLLRMRGAGPETWLAGYFLAGAVVGNACAVSAYAGMGESGVTVSPVLLRSLLAIAVLIVFQPEIRRALAELGRTRVFATTETKRNVVDQLVQAVSLLAEQRIGALIAIDRDIGTRAIQETGVKLDSRVSSGLLASIFYPHTPLHDGGVIIRGNTQTVSFNYLANSGYRLSRSCAV